MSKWFATTAWLDMHSLDMANVDRWDEIAELLGRVERNQDKALETRQSFL